MKIELYEKIGQIRKWEDTQLNQRLKRLSF
jgi:hypothetical protein